MQRTVGAQRGSQQQRFKESVKYPMRTNLMQRVFAIS